MIYLISPSDEHQGCYQSCVISTKDVMNNFACISFLYCFKFPEIKLVSQRKNAFCNLVYFHSFKVPIFSPIFLLACPFTSQFLEN